MGDDKEISLDNKLIWELSSEGSRLIPSDVFNRSNLFTIQKQIKNVSWELQGEELLRKDYFSSSDLKLAKLLLLKGIPDKYHGEFWYVASNAKKEHLEHPNYYNFLEKNYPPNIELPNEKQIELDVKRTFPKDEYFKKQTTIDKLTRILLTYSKRNLSIGYVQGFNFIVGRLMKFIEDEEKIFWTFTQIIEYILPINYYSEMAGVMSDVDILICLLEQKYIPELKKMKSGSYMYLKNILFQWFLSLFVVNFSDEASILIWDVIFLEKEVAMFKAGVTLIKMYKNEILNSLDLEKLQMIINSKYVNFNELNFLTFELLTKKFYFNKKFIILNRNEIEKAIIDKINMTNQIKISKLKEIISKRKDPCDQEWTYCIYDYESYYTVIDHLVLKQMEKPKIIKDYFDSDDLNTISSSSENKTLSGENMTIKMALIERKKHICSDKLYSAYNSICHSIEDKNQQNPQKEEKDVNKTLKKDIQTENNYFGDLNNYHSQKLKYKTQSIILFKFC